MARFRTAMRDAGPPARAVLVLSTVGGLLVIAADFLTLYTTKVMMASCGDLAANPAAADACQDSGGEHHLYAFVLLGLAMVVMGAGAAAGRSRPAAWALVALAVVVLAITLAIDLPDAFASGAIGASYEEAHTRPALGFWVQIVGAGMALLAGVMRLNRPGGVTPGEGARPRRRAARRGPLAERRARRDNGPQ